MTSKVFNLFSYLTWISGSLFITLLFPIDLVAVENTALHLSKSTLSGYVSTLQISHHRRYRPAQLFLLNRKLEKPSDISHNLTILQKLDQITDWSLKPIVTVERINVYLKKQDHSGLLLFLGDLANSTEAGFFEMEVFAVLQETYTDSHDPDAVKKTLVRLLPAFSKWKKDPELINWILKYFDQHDALYPELISQLWAVTDTTEFPVSQLPYLKAQLKQLKLDPETVATHFNTQYQLKNWTYILSEAPAYLRHLLPESSVFRRTRSTYFKTFFRKQQYARLIEILNSPAQARSLSLTPNETATLLFRLWLKKGHTSNAKTYLAILEKTAPEAKLTPRYFELAEFYFSKNRLSESLFYYNRIQHAHASEDLVPLVQWRKLWAHRALNQTAEMKDIMRWASTYSFQSKEVAAKFCYWSIKLKLNNQRTPLSCHQEHPLTYYGFRALQLDRNYNGIKKSAVRNHPASKPRSLVGSELDFLEFIHILYLSKKVELADALVMRYLAKQFDVGFFNHLSRILFQADRYYLQQVLVNLYSSESIKNTQDVNNPLLIAYYPAGYLREIQHHIGRSDLPQMLVFAVIREESNFRAEVKSPAGAVGLMQLMPTTARYVAKTIRTKYQPTLLNHPDFNVKLGVAYLKRLLRRYKGNLFYTLAAYNGGATNVKRWKRKTGSRDFDHFVETITFLETQNYVKRVIRSYHIYQLLYGEKIPKDTSGLLGDSSARVPNTSARKEESGTRSVQSGT
jgi:soluble lytic murein transglycosylase-like protein